MLPSPSFATIVPIAVWFSSTEKVSPEVNIGALSFRLLILTVIIWSVDNKPSLAWTVNKYDCLVS